MTSDRFFLIFLFRALINLQITTKKEQYELIVPFTCRKKRFIYIFFVSERLRIVITLLFV